MSKPPSENTATPPPTDAVFETMLDLIHQMQKALEEYLNAARDYGKFLR